ncbi:hypothetical protein ACFX1Q_038136 [Malus domestica]
MCPCLWTVWLHQNWIYSVHKKYVTMEKKASLLGEIFACLNMDREYFWKMKQVLQHPKAKIPNPCVEEGPSVP